MSAVPARAMPFADDFEDASCGMMSTSETGKILRVNSRFAQWCGRSAYELTAGLRLQDLLAPASLILHEMHYVPLIQAQGVAHEVALDLARPDGTRFPILMSAVRKPAATGALLRIDISAFDATATRRHERALLTAREEAEAAAQALAQQKEQLRVTLRSIADAVITTDAEGRITSANPTAVLLTGIAEESALGCPKSVLGLLLDPSSGQPLLLPTLRDMESDGRDVPARMLLRRHDGGERFISGTRAPIRDAQGRATGTVWVFRDITEEHQSSQRLAYEASHDHLTGLPNRMEFERRLAALMPGTGEGRGHLVGYVDLDQFKILNDTGGHVAGDTLLVQVAKLLRDELRQADTLARLGGDEFGLLLPGCSLEDGRRIADGLRDRLAAYRFHWKGRAHGITMSIGLAMLDADTDARLALSNADLACNAAKEAGRNRVHSFEPDDERLRARKGEMGWVSRIRRALDDDRFVLYFQPIVSIEKSASPVQHGELLLRMTGENGELLSPGEFIPAAERFHQMQQIDRCVVRKALRWLCTVPNIHASINVSGESFSDEGFLAYVNEEFHSSGANPAQVCFEITETAAIADLPSALHFIDTLRGRGVQFSLDDFGAGLSSFSYLKTLPVDYVKIDGSFVKRISQDPVSRAIVESIHRIAQLSNLRTVAEWVEDDQALEELRGIGVDFAQGWGVGRPVPIEIVGLSGNAETRRKFSR